MIVALEDAADWLGRGGLLAFPTETVWGLAADARSKEAVGDLRAFKGRGDDAPISVLVDGFASLEALGFRPDANARALAARFWPGPLTLVMPCGPTFAPGIARGDGAVGVRCSSHPGASALARTLASRRAGPATATSLNASGDPAATNRDEARAVCEAGEPAPAVLDVESDAGLERESTVVDVCDGTLRVLRAGAIEEERLEEALRETR